MDVVASSITIGALAVNVANSVVKLKKCWDSIQDAPEDIQFLIERVDLLSQILRDVEEDQTQNSISSKLLDDSTASKCLKTCKAAADRLTQLSEKMAMSIDTSRQLKRKWISAKVVLKKHKILKFEKELQFCISLLQLSHDTYTRSLLRLQPEIIYAKVVQAVSSGAFPTSNGIQDHQADSAVASTPSPVTVSRSQSSEIQSYQSFWQSTSVLDILGSLRFRTRYYKKRRLIGTDDVEDTELHQELTAQYRLPRWLANQAWDFCAKKAYNSWDFQLRQCVIIPSDSLAFQCIEQRNVRGLQELFSKREASPWSCDEDGWTLLHYAFIFKDAAVCKLLLNLGADMNYQNHKGHSTLSYFVSEWTIEDLDNLHLNRGIIHDSEIRELRYYQGTPEDFVELQQCLFPEYYETALEERFQLAVDLAKTNVWTPALFRLALSRNCIPKLAINMRDKYGQTLLHTVGWAIGSIAAESANGKGNKRGASALEGWRLVLQEMITLGADLHPIDQSSRTPFIQVLNGFIEYWNTRPPSELTIDSGLDFWLNFLGNCGVDLYEYGKREEELWEEALISFTYGSSPGDWSIKIEYQGPDADEKSDRNTGKDSSQVEEIPGAWIED